MKLLCLDLSTKSGWSVLEGENLIQYGNIISKVSGDETSSTYPMNFISMAKDLAVQVQILINQHQPSVVIIEETNKGKNRYSQKQLEFIHFAVNERISGTPVRYLDTSEWRTLLGLSLDKGQRKVNTELNKMRNDFTEVLSQEYDSVHGGDLRRVLSLYPGKREQNRVQKEYNIQKLKWIKGKMKSFRTKKEGKVVGKVTVKTLSVQYVNQVFNTKFKQKDNDITDSICLGLAYQKKCKANFLS